MSFFVTVIICMCLCNLLIRQTTEDSIQSLSLGQWMELPDMSFNQWREEFHRFVYSLLCSPVYGFT